MQLAHVPWPLLDLALCPQAGQAAAGSRQSLTLEGGLGDLRGPQQWTLGDSRVERGGATLGKVPGFGGDSARSLDLGRMEARLEGWVGGRAEPPGMDRGRGRLGGSAAGGKKGMRGVWEAVVLGAPSLQAEGAGVKERVTLPPSPTGPSRLASGASPCRTTGVLSHLRRANSQGPGSGSELGASSHTPGWTLLQTAGQTEGGCQKGTRVDLSLRGPSVHPSGPLESGWAIVQKNARKSPTSCLQQGWGLFLQVRKLHVGFRRGPGGQGARAADTGKGRALPSCYPAPGLRLQGAGS